jgi:hypothetical protein
LLSIPVKFQLQASARLEVYLRSGIAGSLQDPGFGDSYQVPVGAGATYAVSHEFDVGGDFVFPNLGGQQVARTAFHAKTSRA